MARPRCENKRQTILQAATRLFAEEGMAAPTSRIAKVAGVAEGTIFTYFSNKDELINQLYLQLHDDLRAQMAPPPDTAPVRDQLWHAWQNYVNWAITHRAEHTVMAKLNLSPKLTEASRLQSRRVFADVSSLLERALATGALRQRDSQFASAMLVAIGDVTMNYIWNSPAETESISQDGFTAFWNAITGN